MPLPDPYQVAGMQPPQPPQLNFSPMQMSPMRPNNQGQMTQALLQAALRQQAPTQQQQAQPQVGATMPGGAMNITPPQRPAPGGLVGMLSNMFRQQPPTGATVPANPSPPMSSENAIY